MELVMLNQDSLNAFIEDLLQELENDLLQNPSTTHAIQSINGLTRLKQAEAMWLTKILSRNLDANDAKSLQNIGFQLKNTYQLNLHDVFERIEQAQNYCVDNFHEVQKFSANFTITELLETFSKCRKNIANGYFQASTQEITERFENGFFGKNHAMLMHRNWLLELEKHFKDIKNAPLPEMEHSQCKLGRWLNSLEAKLILHSAGEYAFSLRGNILLAHRTLHEEAQLISYHLHKTNYFKAIIHFEILIKAFLLLDKYIDEAEFNYLSNPYQNFIEFVISENKHQKNLDYYFVVHYGLLSEFDVGVRQKRALLNKLQDAFIDYLKDKNIDFICLNHANKLHVVLSEHEQINFNRVEPISTVINNLSKECGAHALDFIYIKLFELDGVQSDNFRHFDGLLNKMLTDSCNAQICEVDNQKIHHYSNLVHHDILTLDVVREHIQNRSFVLYYQPIVDQTNQCQTVESLIRLPINNKLVTAEDFLNLVEYYHLTLEIDQIVFDLIKQDIPKLKGITPMINVNIYPDSLGDKDFLLQIISLAEVCKQNDIVLMVEITEHETLTHDNVLQTLSQKHGIHFAIDDFGTGYSNLAKLAELAGNKTIQMAKLDGALIDGIETKAEKLHVLTFIAEMINNLGLQPIIAEYVDNKEKLAILEDLPIEFFYQGFYFSPALSLEELIENYSKK